MIQSRWFKDRVLLVVFHDNTHAAQDEHIRSGQPNEAVRNQTEKVVSSGHEFVNVLGQAIEFPLSI